MSWAVAFFHSCNVGLSPGQAFKDETIAPSGSSLGSCQWSSLSFPFVREGEKTIPGTTSNQTSATLRPELLSLGRSHTDSRFKLWIHIASLKTSNIPFVLEVSDQNAFIASSFQECILDNSSRLLGWILLEIIVRCQWKMKDDRMPKDTAKDN